MTVNSLMPMTIPAVLTRAASLYGDRPAIVMDDSVLTYAQLEAAANQMAHSLIRHGVRQGDRVALWTPKSIEAIASIWGIMKAGAAYVPIDATAPDERLETIARNCEIAGLVTTVDRAEGVERRFRTGASMRAVWYVGRGTDAAPTPNLPAIGWNEVETESGNQPAAAIDPDGLGVVQYTSGSTGTPKGVMVSHRALSKQAQSTVELFELVPEDRLPSFAPLHSAMSTLDMFATAFAGAAAYPVARRLASFPAALVKSWSEQRLTVWFVVPSVLIMMLNRGDLGAVDLSALRLICFTGETFPLERLRELMQLLPWVRFIHSYSRTEVRIRTRHEVKFPPAELDTKRIGRTFAEVRFHVLDENERPVPGGAVGELWVTGPILMNGYWGLPELTAEVIGTIEVTPGNPVPACRTGDLVKLHNDGVLELIGRADHQVKIRGFRVEIGEVEAALCRHPAVERAVVLAVPDAAQGSLLRAVAVLKEGSQADDRALRNHCAAILPPHMIPETIEFRLDLPLMSNGKVDRRALLEDGGDSAVARRKAAP